MVIALSHPARSPHRRSQSKTATAHGPQSYSVRARLVGIAAVAIAPVVLFTSAVALQNAYGAGGYLQAAAWLTAATLPVLAGLAAVLIISVAAETMILRWLIYLERLARAYSKGRYSVRPNQLSKAPDEFHSLGLAVADMAEAVEERDHALRAALNEQTVLLREVHHRVKNNLQIITSLLGLQASRSTDIATKEALTDALVRIDAMGLSQRFMQPTEAEDRVNAHDLFSALASQLHARLSGSVRRLQVIVQAEDRMIGLDLGARLVLIAVEGVMQAYRRRGAAALTCVISLSADGGQIVLTLTAPNEPEAFTGADGVWASLIDGYVRQVRGTLERSGGKDGVMVVRAALED